MDIDADGGLTLHEANLDAATCRWWSRGLLCQSIVCRAYDAARCRTWPGLAEPARFTARFAVLDFARADASRIRKSTLVGNQKSKEIFVTDWFNPSP